MRLSKMILCISLCVSLFSEVAFSETVLITTIDISEAGEGKRMLLGDVTGDGRLEMIMMQGDRMDDDRYIGHEVNCLTVYDCDGKKLWQIGDPTKGSSTGSDIPAQVYDIDQDGFNEVLACMDGKLRILNGKDGKEKSSFAYPHQNCAVNRVSAVNRSVSLCGTHHGVVSYDYNIFNLQGKMAGRVNSGYKMRKVATGVYISQWPNKQK